MSVAINIDQVIKRYGKLTIIPGLTEHIRNGEFFTLLGPSGCGKTTLLRMIAGFNTIEGGKIRFNDQVINDIPAHKRNIGMVFQSYAIFPHMTVRENVEYGLKLRKMPKAEMKEKVDKILDVVQITEYQDRLPERLSGGQQQRVALARAIVIHPSVLLMDEPLSNLDAKLRVEMRSAIREVQKQVGITTVYVTHDQEEALSISDRIAVMKKGEIQQTARPHTVYTRPYNIFVSTFIGPTQISSAADCRRRKTASRLCSPMAMRCRSRRSARRRALAWRSSSPCARRSSPSSRRGRACAAASTAKSSSASTSITAWNSPRRCWSRDSRPSSSARISAMPSTCSKWGTR